MLARKLGRTLIKILRPPILPFIIFMLNVFIRKLLWSINLRKVEGGSRWMMVIHVRTILEF